MASGGVVLVHGVPILALDTVKRPRSCGRPPPQPRTRAVPSIIKHTLVAAAAQSRGWGASLLLPVPVRATRRLQLCLLSVRACCSGGMASSEDAKGKRKLSSDGGQAPPKAPKAAADLVDSLRWRALKQGKALGGPVLYWRVYKA